MVIRGNIRGNGGQLAQYLLTEGGNERIHILEVDGRVNASEPYLHQTLQTMSLTAELTRSDKGLYHAQINPAYSEDRSMTDDDWQRAADILGHELGLGEQRRVIVLHTKKDRTHAHVVFERYDHETGKVIDNKFSRLAQDRARKEMERVFEHAPTPHRNKHQPELKDRLTKLWQETNTASDFINAVDKSGCMLAEGVPRHPFMVVDENGRSFDLVRQLKGVRIKEVRQRMRGAELIPEKEAIEIMRRKNEEGSSDAHISQQPATDQNEKAVKRATEFFANTGDIVEEDPAAEEKKKQLQIVEMFLQTAPEMMDAQIQNDLPKKEKNTTTPESALENLKTTEPNEGHKEHREQNNTEQHRDHEEPEKQSDQERRRERLKDFMLSGDELTTKLDSSPDKQQRQKNMARQFFDNDDMFAQPQSDSQPLAETDDPHPQTSTGPELTATISEDNAEVEHDALLQKMVQEQKALRERRRQGHKRRIR